MATRLEDRPGMVAAPRLSPPPPGPEVLAEAFVLLANAQRIGLLRLLQVPHSVGDIRLPPGEARQGSHPRPAMSPQAVRKHLDRLLEHHFVQSLPARGETGAEMFVVNHARLYALAEEMRALAMLRPAAEAPGRTEQLAAEPPAPEPGAPRLVVVHGLREGHSYPLAAGCVVGRGKSCDVRLDYDPFVSQQHASLRQRGDAWLVEDLGSRNGTLVNWLALPKKGSQALRHGDVVGVGRTLLLFWG